MCVLVRFDWRKDTICGRGKGQPAYAAVDNKVRGWGGWGVSNLQTVKWMGWPTHLLVFHGKRIERALLVLCRGRAVRRRRSSLVEGTKSHTHARARARTHTRHVHRRASTHARRNRLFVGIQDTRQHAPALPRETTTIKNSGEMALQARQTGKNKTKPVLKRFGRNGNVLRTQGLWTHVTPPGAIPPPMWESAVRQRSAWKAPAGPKDTLARVRVTEPVRAAGGDGGGRPFFTECTYGFGHSVMTIRSMPRRKHREWGGLHANNARIYICVCVRKYCCTRDESEQNLKKCDLHTCRA